MIRQRAVSPPPDTTPAAGSPQTMHPPPPPHRPRPHSTTQPPQLPPAQLRRAVPPTACRSSRSVALWTTRAAALGTRRRIGAAPAPMIHHPPHTPPHHAPMTAATIPPLVMRPRKSTTVRQHTSLAAALPRHPRRHAAHPAARASSLSAARPTTQVGAPAIRRRTSAVPATSSRQPQRGAAPRLPVFPLLVRGHRTVMRAPRRALPPLGHVLSPSGARRITRAGGQGTRKRIRGAPETTRRQWGRVREAGLHGGSRRFVWIRRAHLPAGHRRQTTVAAARAPRITCGGGHPETLCRCLRAGRRLPTRPAATTRRCSPPALRPPLTTTFTTHVCL